MSDEELKPNETWRGSDINGLARRVHTIAKEKGWWPEQEEGRGKNIPEALALIHSEVSEALEDYRDDRMEVELIHDGNGKPEGFPIELADIIIRVLDLAVGMNIDIAMAIALKVRYNEMRPHRHGGKKC